MKLVQVPAPVFERYRDLGAAVQAFIEHPEIRSALRQTYRLDAAGVEQWTAFGLLVQAHRRLSESFDAADAALRAVRTAPSRRR